MYKLTVVAGPARGTSYRIRNGETSIGRVSGNDIVLASNQVSKRHCVLIVNDAEVILKDNGSSNGTFVNGELTRKRRLLPGDRVSVGDYVFELSEQAHAPSRQSSRSRGSQNMDNVIPLYSDGGSQLPASGVGGFLPQDAAHGNAAVALPLELGAAPQNAAAPKTLKDKAKLYFEQYIVNFVYNLNERHEWRNMMAGMFALLTFACAVLSVTPVLERVHEKLSDEAIGRAFMLARQMVDRNASFIYERLETKVDVSFVEKEPGVLAAYLVDMEGRIMAPGRKLNQYLTEPTEAAFSAQARSSFQNKESLEKKAIVSGNTVAVAVPLRVFSAASGKNVTVALGLVFFDQGMILFDPGTEALTYIQALILSAIVAILVFFTLYRLTLKPLASLNDGIDQVLKGTSSSVGKQFKMEEINPLIDVVNAALQRVVSTNKSQAFGGGIDPEVLDGVVALLKFSSDRMTGVGMMIFSNSKKILHLNPYFEEISGIHNNSALGADISAAARDAAFVSFVDDILVRAPSAGMDAVSEDFEFSGTMYRMECLSLGRAGTPELYILTATRQG
ncbi:MAG: FHA domain-containing protein [Bdellovibrionota bacterium]